MSSELDRSAEALAEKKRKRLERNRESARECRKRKKEKKDLLKQQLAHLEADNLQLRLKLQVGHESNTDINGHESITAKLESMIREGASEGDIQNTVAELQERYSDYGRDRRSAIDFHVSQLRRCLQPTQTTRAILWLMSLAAQFHDPLTGEIRYSEPSDVFNLWLDLLNETKPTPQQKKLMVSYTQGHNGNDPFAAIKSVTQTCNSMLDRLVGIICNKNESLDSEMANIQTILSPTQIAKFILWIDENPATMQMLEALWPHISTHIQSHQQQQQSQQQEQQLEQQLEQQAQLTGQHQPQPYAQHHEQNQENHHQQQQQQQQQHKRPSRTNSMNESMSQSIVDDSEDDESDEEESAKHNQ